MKKDYIPCQGDLVIISFDPQTGHEQKGRRPGLVVSKDDFNKCGLAMVCPLTNTDRMFPFHTAVPDSCSLTGFIMTEQVKSIDCRVRNIKFVEKAPEEVLTEVLSLIDAILF